MPITNLPILPALIGMGWPTKTPKFSTRTQKAVSGRQRRIIDQAFPIWQFSVPFNVLRDGNDVRASSGLGGAFNEMRTLAGLFLASYGAAGVFAFDDPSDDTVIGAGAATGICDGGDGSTAQFQLYRQFLGGGGQLREPIIAPNVVTNAYVNGVDPGGWSVNAFGVLTFGSAPANGAAITWSGSFYFPCHFTDDSIDLEYLMFQVWSLKELKFESVLP